MVNVGERRSKAPTMAGVREVEVAFWVDVEEWRSKAPTMVGVREVEVAFW